MSLSYWGFTQMPFSKELPIGAYYLSTQFQELAARLHVMVTDRLFGVVTGEVGSGKSSAVRYLAAQLDPSEHPVFYIAESQLTPYDFYSQVLESAGVREHALPAFPGAPAIRFTDDRPLSTSAQGAGDCDRRRPRVAAPHGPRITLHFEHVHGRGDALYLYFSGSAGPPCHVAPQGV